MLREALSALAVAGLAWLWFELRARRAERRWKQSLTGNSDVFFANHQRNRYTGFWT